MNITKLKIKNYKSIKDSGEITVDDKIMSFIGQNNAGKSAILDAIKRKFVGFFNKIWDLEKDFLNQQKFN